MTPSRLPIPTSKVLFGGVAFDWFHEDGGHFVRSFVNDVLAIDKGQHFDYFNYHAYPAYSATWIQAMNPDCVATNRCEGPGLLEKHQYLMSILAAAWRRRQARHRHRVRLVEQLLRYPQHGGNPGPICDRALHAEQSRRPHRHDLLRAGRLG